MLLNLIVNHQIVYVLSGAAAFGIILNLVEDSIYKRWMRCVQRIEQRPRHWMGRMKTRFEGCYKMKIGVRKIDLFVRNSLDGRRVLGIRMRAWERISAQVPLVVLAAGISVGLYAMREHFSPAECVAFAGIGAVLAILGFAAERLIGVRESRERLQNILNEYFSNVLRPQLEQIYLTRPAMPMPTVEMQEEVAATLEQAPEEPEPEKPQTHAMARQARIAEKRRKAEEKARKQREALQATYEEKKRRLESKYQALQKDLPTVELPACAEAAAAKEIPSEEATSKPAKEVREMQAAAYAEDGIDCSAENLANPDFIEAVLREYL